MIRAALAGAALAMAAAIPAAHAFNTYNDTPWPICVYSSDHGGYFEAIGPHGTSHGWAIDAPMNLQVAVMDLQVCVGENESDCHNVCNEYTSSCTTNPHTQQVVYGIHYEPGNPSSEVGQYAAYLAGFSATFDLSCNN